MKQSLKQYNQKRDFLKTQEPIGKLRKKGAKLIFVVQHHLARKDHYDFRLEWNGVLLSFAVPKGPSFSHKDKRLAIHVEDHPYDYHNFEGVIPKGEYGGGPVMVWDTGYYEPFSGFTTDISSHQQALKFFLKGTKLYGKWILIPFKDQQWLLVKEQDSFLGFRNISLLDYSVKTFRKMEDIIKQKKLITSKRKHLVCNVSISHSDKIIFSKPKITKYDIAFYYSKVFSRMYPFLQHRFISTIRAPEGLEGEKFFKKHFSNSDFGKVLIPNQNGKKEDYYYVKNIEGLIQEVQMNGFEFHLWGCHKDHLNHPDMLVFDLDPDENMSLKKIREGVLDLKSILDELSLISFLKTSGGKGYHVVVPIQSLKNWEEFRNFAQNIAKLMEAKWPDKYVSNMRKEKRKGKIFVDWIRNTKGATSVAPYSIRIRKGAKVSMPISWKELYSVKPDEITMKEAILRLKRKNPWEDFFYTEQ